MPAAKWQINNIRKDWPRRLKIYQGNKNQHQIWKLIRIPDTPDKRLDKTFFLGPNSVQLTMVQTLNFPRIFFATEVKFVHHRGKICSHDAKNHAHDAHFLHRSVIFCYHQIVSMETNKQTFLIYFHSPIVLPINTFIWYTTVLFFYLCSFEWVGTLKIDLDRKVSI